MRFLFLILIFFSLTQTTMAMERTVTLELQQVNLPDAIRLLAKFIDKNVVIAETVAGSASLHLREANPTQAFQTLLATHGLASSQRGAVCLVAPRSELIKYREEEEKWLQVTDATSPLVSAFWQLHYANVEEVATRLKAGRSTLLSKRGYVLADKRTNVLGVQDTASRVRTLHQWIKRLDVSIPQIAIDARLASVDSDHERELGIDFSVKSLGYETGGNKEGTQSSAATVGKYSLAIAKLADGSWLDVKLAALENAGHAELISSPSLFTANQQSASIEAGEEVPYQEVSQSGGTAVVFKKAVLGLKVTPQVMPGNKVLLQLQINQDRPSNHMVLGVPTISTRQITTNVLVKTGQTIVLGGIYETNTERGEQRVPFISQVPLIGLLFQQHHTRKNKRELLIFVTPRMITPEP